MSLSHLRLSQLPLHTIPLISSMIAPECNLQYLKYLTHHPGKISKKCHPPAPTSSDLLGPNSAWQTWCWDWWAWRWRRGDAPGNRRIGRDNSSAGIPFPKSLRSRERLRAAVADDSRSKRKSWRRKSGSRIGNRQNAENRSPPALRHRFLPLGRPRRDATQPPLSNRKTIRP